LIINSGIKRVVYKGNYPDELSMQLLSEAGIKVERFE
jgi:dCMP deaminase